MAKTPPKRGREPGKTAAQAYQQASADIRTVITDLLETLRRTETVCGTLSETEDQGSKLSTFIGDVVLLTLYGTELYTEAPVTDTEKAMRLRKAVIKAIEQFGPPQGQSTTIQQKMIYSLWEVLSK